MSRWSRNGRRYSRPDEGPVLQPFVELEFQELVEEGAGGIAHRGDPGFGGEVFEFVAVNAAAVVLRPEGAQGDEVFHGIAARVVAEEFDDAPFPLAAEVGGELEEFIQQRMGRGGEGIGGEMADGEAAELAAEAFHLADDFLERVAGENFIRSFATEDDFQVLAGTLGEFVKGDDEGIAHRAVHVPDDLAQEIEIMRLADDLVVVGAEESGRLGGVLGFILRGTEADAVGVDVAAVAHHVGDDEAGVHTAAEVGADGDIAAHAEGDGIVPEGFQFLVIFVVGAVMFPIAEDDVPVAFDGNAAVGLAMQVMGGAEFLDAFKHRLRLGDISEAEIGIDGGDVGRGADMLTLQERLRFARKEQPSVGAVPVERLLSGTVPGDEIFLPAFVAQTEGKHAIEFRQHSLDAPLLVAVEDGFGITVRGEAVAEGLEFDAQFLVVVNFAIENDRAGAVLIVDRLPAPAEVDDAQPDHPHVEAGLFVKTLPVGSTMFHGAGHFCQQPLLLESSESKYATHAVYKEADCQPGNLNSSNIHDPLAFIEPTARRAFHEWRLREVIELRAADVAADFKFQCPALPHPQPQNLDHPDAAEQSQQDAEVVNDEFRQGGLEHAVRHHR